MLSSLSRGFEATLVAEQLVRTTGARAIGDLLREGILRDAGVSSTALRCVCDLQRPRCTPPVDERDGAYVALCPEFGRPVSVEVDLLQRYRFDWPTWAARIRNANSLSGEGPTLGAGVLLVGDGTVAGREFRLAVIAPSCRLSTEVIFPDGARRDDKPIVAILLGAAIQGLRMCSCVPAAAFGPDLVTVDLDAVERALDDVPVAVTSAATTKCMMYDAGHKRGRAIDEVEYARLHRTDVLAGYDILIDLLLGKVWRNGRACGTVLDAKGHSKGKKLGDRAVSLLADYVRRPGVPMVAGETPTYRDVVVGDRSAAILLGDARRSIRGKSFIRTGARSHTPGETTYVFEPGSMKWCVLGRLPGR